MTAMSFEKYTLDGQDPKVTEKIYGKIRDMLTANESISYIALQKKPAVTLLPDSIAVSNKRIFLGEFTKLGFATNFEIFAWQDIKDIAFKEEIFGSKVTVIPFTGENLTIDYIPKVQARKLYQLIKDALEKVKEEKSKEKETIIIEHKPVIQQVSPTQENPVVPPMSSATKTEPSSSPENKTSVPSTEDDEVTQKLKKLKNLFDKQLISQAEYESKKTEILKDL